MSFIVALLFWVSVRSCYADTELLTAPWNFSGNNNDSQKYQSISATVLAGKSKLRLTYNLHGATVLGGDASAIIFDQPLNGTWRYISLSSYGQNGFNGSQTVDIPLLSFTGLNTALSVGTFHGRFWYGSAFTVDVTSALLVDAVSPTPTPAPSATPTRTPTPSPTPSPTPTPTPRFSIRSVDAMKVTKDVICTSAQKDDPYISQWVDKAKELGASYVAISQPYDSPACGDTLSYTQRWVTAIRAKGLKVWHRHMPLSQEGIYAVGKNNTDFYYDLISNYITQHPTFFAAGDIFTPIPEPQNGGISGVIGCNGTCQYGSQNDFNRWIKGAMLVSELSFKAIGLDTQVKIGYFGFDGFITWGDNNPDWHGILTDSTIARMGTLAIDHYPSDIASMSGDLLELRAKYPTTPLVISEWGTISATDSATQVSQIQIALSAFSADPGIVGVNYWTLGPGGNESLINSDFTTKSGYAALQSFYSP